MAVREGIYQKAHPRQGKTRENRGGAHRRNPQAEPVDFGEKRGNHRQKQGDYRLHQIRTAHTDRYAPDGRKNPGGIAGSFHPIPPQGHRQRRLLLVCRDGKQHHHHRRRLYGTRCAGRVHEYDWFADIDGDCGGGHHFARADTHQPKPPHPQGSQAGHHRQSGRYGHGSLHHRQEDAPRGICGREESARGHPKRRTHRIQGRQAEYWRSAALWRRFPVQEGGHPARRQYVVLYVF